ncbi:MAG: tetratricopeptide repeat protein [Candidatus Sulfotelmatobacter sp.]|jgi:tetratricopeptide (TPR) repeat protein
MALFGFNKQKVLANAEKYVQQGKLPNAISEYEKILKNDAKDLTVTNTVGDLYSRIGEADKATECFKTVGDAYASQGFTVKAIAMYKKISKLKPSLESLLKLAELYTQQGLFNDARAQYLQVAEEFLKANELENAVRIFQKILEMDPENTTMRVRLAEVYVRLGKKAEAWQIFTAAAESMRSKGSLNGADEILQRMLALEPGNAYALLMQGKNQAESGDAAGAVATLLKVADIDSNPDGLRDLLKAYLQTGQLSEAGATANKLLTVHNDLTAISSFADALMQAGQYDTALQVYDEHAERLLAENSDKVLAHLHSIIGHVRDNPASLEKLLDLFNKAGETTHVSEVIELLAHASVQAGDLPRARDLYQKLAQVEPQNPLHMQNYQQVVSQLSGTSDVKLITPEEAVVLIDDIEATAPSVHQHYSDEVALAVRSALTDAELFISYNMPAKALGPLVTVLPMAPNDLRINQRLAALHTRAGRFADAGVCCRTLQNLYSEAGYPDEATRYGELAERYEERSSAPGTAVAHEEAHIFLDAPAPAPAAHAAQPEVATSEPEAVPEAEAEPEVEVVEEASEAEAEAAEEVAVEPAEATEFAVVEDSAAVPAEAAAEESEIDLSAEWDDSVTVEAETPEAEVPEAGAAPAEGDSTKTQETIEEIRFYLANGMPEQAMAALAKLQTLTGDHDLLAELRAEVEAAAQQPSEEVQVETEPVVEELTADDIPTIEVTPEEAPEAIEETAAAAEAEEVPVAEETAAVEPEPEPGPEPEPEPEPVASEPAHPPAVLTEFVSDLESSLGDKFLPGTGAKPAKRPVPPPPPAHAPAPAAHAAPVLGKFVADIEASLGEDFLKAAPVAKPQPSAPAVKVVPAAPVVTPAAALKAGPAIAASAAASASAPAYVAPPAVAPAPASAPPAWPAPAVEAPQPHAPAAAAPHAPAAAAASPFGEEAGVDLAEMFGELKQDLEADVAAADEDPETHYNLGIAFREMGLLDEAIGELQKACQFFDRGHAFPQIMQTYTWLAQCFLDKGVPEAAVRWYEKALGVPTIDGETRVALNYELASAYETAGDKPAALKHFMDVYGTNIDYRDVAERIKALKS